MASENAITSARNRPDTLVHRTGTGDPSSWNEIFDRYFGPNRSNCTFYAVLFDVSEGKAVKDYVEAILNEIARIGQNNYR